MSSPFLHDLEMGEVEEEVDVVSVWDSILACVSVVVVLLILGTILFS